MLTINKLREIKACSIFYVNSRYRFWYNFFSFICVINNQKRIAIINYNSRGKKMPSNENIGKYKEKFE